MILYHIISFDITYYIIIQYSKATVQARQAAAEAAAEAQSITESNSTNNSSSNNNYQYNLQYNSHHILMVFAAEAAAEAQRPTFEVSTHPVEDLMNIVTVYICNYLPYKYFKQGSNVNRYIFDIDPSGRGPDNGSHGNIGDRTCKGNSQ